MLTLRNTSLVINAGDERAPAEYHYVWLRDNCPCAECRHPDTQERVLVTHSIAPDIAPLQATFSGDELAVTWNQGHHQSRYSSEWLAKHNYSQHRFNTDPAAGTPQLWGNEFENSIPTFTYQDLYQDTAALLAWCEAIRDYGLTIVRGAPLETGEIERFANHVAFVRETIYDRLHNVRATPGEYNAYNVASTTLELKPHTDMPVYNNPPGVQMFHFLVNESEGGNSTAVDGFQVAAKLKQQDPQAFQLLSQTPVNFKMFSARGDLEARNPLLTLDTNGELKVFRYSNQLAQPANLSSDEMLAFYDAYQKLGKLVEDPRNMVEFRLNTGDMMATNNLRVMHGRKAFDPSTGDRHLQLTYMDMDDVLSRIRMIRKNANSALSELG